jgi:hypothetical protein
MTVAELGLRVNTFGDSRLFTIRRVDGMVRHLLNSKTRTEAVAVASEWSQAKPDRWCGCGGSNPRMGRCRNPRCSFEGRSGWAKKWATVLTMHLERQSANVAKYAGTLIGPRTDRAGVVERRSAFVRSIRSRFGGGVRFLAVSEVGPVSGRLHDHFVMVSEVGPVSESEVSTLWRKACGDHPGAKVDHGPIRNVPDWSNYIFKNDDKYHDTESPDCVRLLAKGSTSITWGSRFLSEKDRERLWAEKVAGWYPASESAEVVEMNRGTGVPQQTTKVVINARESIERNRPSEPVETRSGTVESRNNPTTNVRILYGKSTVKSRVTGQCRAAWRSRAGRPPSRVPPRRHGGGAGRTRERVGIIRGRRVPAPFPLARPP